MDDPAVEASVAVAEIVESENGFEHCLRVTDDLLWCLVQCGGRCSRGRGAGDQWLKQPDYPVVVLHAGIVKLHEGVLCREDLLEVKVDGENQSIRVEYLSDLGKPVIHFAFKAEGVA